MARPRKELQRKPSGIYYVQLYDSDGKRYTKSLDTDDEKVANQRFRYYRQALWNRIRREQKEGMLLPTQAELDAQKKSKFELIPECAGVYFVRWAGDNRAVKIGRSNNIRNRVAQYLTHNYEDLFLLAYQPTPNGGDAKLEKEFHERFEGLRFKGEWFWLEYPLSEQIRTIAASQHWEPLAVGLTS